MDNLKLILVVLITFGIAFGTSVFLDYLNFSRNPPKYIVVVLLIVVEIYFGYLIYKLMSTAKTDSN
jgi:hypothetical protein